MSNGLEIAQLRFATYHIGEAISELTMVQLKLSTATNLVDREILKVKIIHAYQHLNWLWNGLARDDLSATDLSETEFREMSRFPKDLHDLISD